MKKKKLFLTLLVFILGLFTLVSCGNDAPQLDGNSGENNVVIDTNRKIVYTGKYVLYNKDFKAVIRNINSETSILNGYIESSNENEKKAVYVYKIPTNKLNEFLNFVDGVGGVSTKNISTKDVTTSFNSLQAKIDTITLRKEAYLQMINDEPNMPLSTKMEILDKVDELDEKLRTYSYEKATLESDIDYATITIDYYETEADATFEYFATYGRYLLNVGKILCSIILYSLPFAFIALIICLFIFKPWNKKKTSKEIPK